jgi:hypothetical protein
MENLRPGIIDKLFRDNITRILNLQPAIDKALAARPPSN